MPLSFLDSWLCSSFSKGLFLRWVLCLPQTSFFSTTDRFFWSSSACSSGYSAASAACWTFSSRESFPIFSKFLLQTFPSLLLALAFAFPSLPFPRPGFSKLVFFAFPAFIAFITFLGGIVFTNCCCTPYKTFEPKMLLPESTKVWTPNPDNIKPTQKTKNNKQVKQKTTNKRREEKQNKTRPQRNKNTCENKH